MMEERGLDFTAYLTWVIVSIPTMIWQFRAHHIDFIWVACYVAFIVFFALHDRFGLASVTVQSVLAIACCYREPTGFQPVLLVIVAAQLASCTIPVAMAWIVAINVGVMFSFDKP